MFLNCWVVRNACTDAFWGKKFRHFEELIMDFIDTDFMETLGSRLVARVMKCFKIYQIMLIDVLLKFSGSGCSDLQHASS